MGESANRYFIENFPHKKGLHCESTTLRDHLNFLGFPLSEPVVFGLDATMGFAFWENDNNPVNNMMIGGKNGMFSEQSLACRILGVQVNKATFSKESESWTDLLSELKQNHPLIIQADMAYLPFIFDQELISSEMHFGGHILSVVGCEEKKEIAYLADNNFDEVKEISKDLLGKARGSKEGWKGMWPHYTRYYLSRRPDGKRPPLISGIKLAISQVVKNMLAASTNITGIRAIEKFGESIENWNENFLMNKKSTYDFLDQLYGYIEDYGTGGSIFRRLYVQFLTEILNFSNECLDIVQWKEDERELIEESIEYLNDSVKSWSEFSGLLKNSINNKDFDETCLDYTYLKELIDDIVRYENTCFKTLSKLKIG